MGFKLSNLCTNWAGWVGDGIKGLPFLTKENNLKYWYNGI